MCFNHVAMGSYFYQSTNRRLRLDLEFIIPQNYKPLYQISFNFVSKPFISTIT